MLTEKNMHARQCLQHRPYLSAATHAVEQVLLDQFLGGKLLAVAWFCSLGLVALVTVFPIL